MENANRRELTEEEKKVANELISGFFNGLFSMCKECVKYDVCKLKDADNFESDCKHFQNAMNYKRYGNIHDMFQPIFDWLKFHYPAGEVHFLVDGDQAMMIQEHGTSVFNKNNYSIPEYLAQQDGTKKENNK